MSLTAQPVLAQPEPATPELSLTELVAKSQVADVLDAPLAPTGDALFDRYAAEVMQRIEGAQGLQMLDLMKWVMTDPKRRGSPLGTVFMPAQVPLEVLAQWEPDFGNDVRYWELCYFCAQDNQPYQIVPYPPVGLAARFPESADYLREAKRRGLATWSTLMLLYPYDRKDLNQQFEALDQEHIADPSMELPPIAERMRELEQAELALLDEAVESGPDQAWPLFYRVQYWTNLGEWELALDDLEAACNAPQALKPVPFPVAEVQTGIVLGEPRGNIIVSGAITMGAATLPLPNYMRFKEMAKEAETIVALGGDIEHLECLHQFGCRLSECMPFELINVLVGQVISKICITVAGRGDLLELTPEQLDTYQRVMRVYDEFRADCKEVSAGLETVLELQPSNLTEQFGPNGLYIGLYICEETRLLTYYTSLEPKLELLRQVHIPEFNAPEGLQYYEPLIPEPETEGSGE